jgi:addiction module RelB/DinJ family antitoxin
MVTMSTVLHVKLDEDLKRKAQAVARELGLPLSTVVSNGLREFVQTRSITISGTPRLKPEVESELFRRSEEAKRGENISPRFSSISDAKQWLESQA